MDPHRDWSVHPPICNLNRLEKTYKDIPVLQLSGHPAFKCVFDDCYLRRHRPHIVLAAFIFGMALHGLLQHSVLQTQNDDAYSLLPFETSVALVFFFQASRGSARGNTYPDNTLDNTYPDDTLAQKFATSPGQHLPRRHPGPIVHLHLPDLQS